MAGENGSISFPGFSRSDPSTWVPTFGNWCGPNWSAGQRGNTMTRDQLLAAPVQQTLGADGKLRDSPVDLVCKAHDIAYYDASGQPNEATLKLQADLQLEQDIANMNWSNLNSTEKSYTTLMDSVFNAKIQAIDVPFAAIQAIQDQSNSLSQQIISEGGSPAGQSYTDSSGNQMSCQKDANGNLVINCSQNGQTESASKDTNGSVILTHASYDANNQVVSSSTLDTTTNSGTTQNYTNGVLASSTDFGASSATTTTYNSSGTVSGVTTVNSDNSSKSVQYDTYGNTISSSSTDSTGAVTTSTTDPFNGAVTTQYPDGKASTLVDNGNGYTISTSYPNGSTETIAYAPGGSPVSDAISNASGSDAITNYQNGTPTYAAITNSDGSGSIANYNSDGSGSLTTYGADGSNNVTSFQSDGSLIQATATQADGSQSITNYGANNVVSSTIASSADGSGSTTTYNANGGMQQQVFTKADGGVSTTNYSANGQTEQTVVRNADGSGSTSGINADGTSYATVANADGSGNTATYYANGQLATETITNADGSGSSASYTADGTVLSQNTINSNGTSYGDSYSFYSDGTMASETHSYADGSSNSRTYYPDGKLHFQSQTNSDGSGSYTGYGEDGSQDPTISFGANPINPNSIATNTYQDGSIGTTNYGAGRNVTSTSTIYPDGSETTKNYYANGQLSSISSTTPLGVSNNNDGVLSTGSSAFYANDITISGNNLYYGPSKNTSTEYFLGNLVAYNASYYTNGVMSSQSFTLGDVSWLLGNELIGSTDSIFYNANGGIASETRVNANGYKSIVEMYSNGQPKTITNYYVDGSYDVTTYYADPTKSSFTAHYVDGSVQQESFYTNGVMSSSSWTGHPDGTSIYSTGSVDGSTVQTTYSADGSYVEVKNNARGDVTTTNYGSGGVKLSDTWTRANGTSGSDTYNIDGSSSGTTIFQNGKNSSYTNDGQGNVTTINYGAYGLKISDSWVRADGSSGTDSFNSMYDSSSGMTKLSNGSSYSYTNDGQGDIAYRYQFNGTGDIEIPQTTNGNNNLTFGIGISLTDLTVSAAIGSNGKPALLINTGNGDSLIIDGGLDGAIKQFTFSNGNTLTLNQLMAWANSTPVTIAGANGNLIFSANGYNSLVGGAGNDTFYVWNSNNTLVAGTGNQTLISESGNDVLKGGAGNDTLISVTGNNTMVGGTGNTTFVVNSATDVIQAQSTGSNVNTVQTSVDYVAPANVQNLTGVGSANITLTGNNSHDVITANSGSDTLVAGSGYDFMYGSNSDVYYSPLTNQSTDVIYNSGATGGSVYGGSSYGGQSMMDTLDLPAGVNPSDLKWRVFQTPAYPGCNVMQLNYGKANVFIVYSDQSNQTSLGVNAFQFSDGTVLTRDQLMAQATPYNGSSNITSYNPDGSYSSYTQDAFGNTISVSHDANGNKLSDNWTHADGTFGNDTFNSDGSSSGTSYNLDGSYSNYTNDGRGDTITTNYDTYGNKLGYSTAVIDVQGNITTTKYNAIGNEPGYSIAINDGQGIVTTTNYDVNANALGSSVLTIDGQGDATTANYDVNGNILSDSWIKANGSYGNDTFNADGSSSGANYNPDGSYSSYTNDGHGDITTTNYDAFGNELGFSNAVNNGQGSITTTNYDVYGNLLGSRVLINDGQGDTTTTNYDANGNILSDSWIKANGSYGNDTFNYDGTSSGTSYNPDGSYSSYTNDWQGDTTTTNYSSNGTKLSDSWVKADGSYGSDIFNADGSSSGTIYNADGTIESKVSYVYSDGSTYSTDTVNDPNGSYQQIWSNSAGSTGSINYNAVTGEVIGSNVTAGAGYSYTYDNTQNAGGVSGITESKVVYTYTDGSTYSTDTVNDPNGSYQQTWAKSDGSTGSTNSNATTGEVIGINATAGAGYSYTYDNTVNVGGVSGVTESKVNYLYTGGATYSTDTVNDPNGSYQQTWTKSDGSAGSTNYNAVTGEMIGSNATAGAGYSYTYDNTQNIGGAIGVTELKVAYTYTNGSTYSTDTVNDPNGSYQQTWSKSDGSTGSTNYNAATGEVTGSNATAGAGYSYTYDNIVNVGGVSGITESKVDYLYTGGATYSTDTVNDPNGSYQQTWAKSDGSTGSTDYNAATGEVIGSNSTTGAGYSYTYDNTLNVGGMSGVTESKVAYTYANGSTYSTDTVNDTNGSYQQTWGKSDGSTGSTNYNAATGEVIGSNATAGAGYSYTYDNTQNVGGVSGVTESKVAYTYANGSTYSTDTVNDPNGSYQQTWAKSDGSTGSTNYNSATGEVIGSNATAGAGYSYTYDNTINVGGVSGVTESKVNYTYTGGATYNTDTVSDSNGSYQQTWSKSDGSTGSTNYNAMTGEVIGSNATAGAGYSYTYDNTINVGGVSGVTESKVNYTYTHGSTYNTDTVTNPDGSYFQSWSNSNGTAGSSAVNASGTLIGDSVVNADGSQEVDAGGNHLIMGSAANNNVVAASGNDILIGAAGNATITTGSGTNLVAFNVGNGQEIVNDAQGQNNTISLGGNFVYSDLALQKSGNNLVLDIGASDSITFQNWYAGNQNIVNLQVVASAMSDFAPGSTNVLSNSNVETFDFQKLVNAFDQAQAANPTLNAWGVTNSLLDAHLSGSNSSALGGDLAYVYGTNGNLTGFGVSAAQGELSNSQFASAPQALNPWPTLNTGTAHIR